MVFISLDLYNRRSLEIIAAKHCRALLHIGMNKLDVSGLLQCQAHRYQTGVKADSFDVMKEGSKQVLGVC